MATPKVQIEREPTEEEKDLTSLLHRTFTDHHDAPSGISWHCPTCLDVAVIILRRFGQKGA